VLQVDTVQVQQTKTQDLQKLVEVITRRNGQPLDPRLTKKETT